MSMNKTLFHSERPYIHIFESVTDGMIYIATNQNTQKLPVVLLDDVKELKFLIDDCKQGYKDEMWSGEECLQQIEQKMKELLAETRTAEVTRGNSTPSDLPSVGGRAAEGKK